MIDRESKALQNRAINSNQKHQTRKPKNQRAGCVGVVFLVVKLGIQAFSQDVKFKVFMPSIRSRYLRIRIVIIVYRCCETML